MGKGKTEIIREYHWPALICICQLQVTLEKDIACDAAEEGTCARLQVWLWLGAAPEWECAVDSKLNLNYAEPVINATIKPNSQVWNSQRWFL